VPFKPPPDRNPKVSRNFNCNYTFRIGTLYSGLVPGYVGLYQVNVRVPSGLAPGLQPVSMAVNLTPSNEVQIAVQ
jgi:uncharacterized protein (TIGR03437 family)